MWGALSDRENGFIVYDCCRSSAVRSFLFPSPAGIIFSCLRFETTRTWRVRSPYLYLSETGWLSYIPRHGFHFVASYDSYSNAPHKTSSLRAISKLSKLLEQTTYSSRMKCRVSFVVMDFNEFHKLHCDILGSMNIAAERQQDHIFIY
jgi:hypothetical protein